MSINDNINDNDNKNANIYSKQQAIFHKTIIRIGILRHL